MNYVEPDPPISYSYGAFPGEVSGESVSHLSNSIADQDNSLLLDQVMRLKEENYRQFSRIAFLEDMLKREKAETRHVLKMLAEAQAQVEQALALGKTFSDDDFAPVPVDSPYYIRKIAPQMKVMQDQFAAQVFENIGETLSRAIRQTDANGR